MTLAVSVRSELLKTKRTAAFYFTLIGAAVVPLLIFFNVLSDGLPDQERSIKDPLNALFKLSTEMTGIAIFPWFIILLCTLLPQIEFRNNTWKQVLASPQTKGTVFLAKLINIHLLMLLFLVANQLLMWLVAAAIHVALPDLNLLQRPFNGSAAYAKLGNAYLMLLGVSAIQFWLGLRFKNFLVPVAIGFVLWMIGSVMVFEYQSGFAPYFPYCFHALNFSPKHQAQLTTTAWSSAGYGLFFLTLCFVDFKRRKFHG